MRILEKSNKFYTKIEEIVMNLTAFILTLLTLIAVFNRYFLKHSMAWYEEVIMMFYMILVYWGASNVAKDNAHLRVTILLDKLKGKANIYLNLFIELFCLIISIIGIYFSIKMCLTTTMRTVDLRIPNSIILFLSLVMGFFGLSWRYLYQFVVSLNKLKRKKISKVVSNND